jgi:ferrous iron transport protein B
MEKKLNIALAGNMNVGKSVIFNSLTGLHQHIGNWPGKTVERAEGTLHYKGYTIDIIDLPGIYSLSTFSIEELISREYIAVEKPDLVINVVDASILERNLFFSLQLLELDIPLIMALNQVDVAKKKGIAINHRKLQKLLGVPVIPTVAVKDIGIHKLMDEAIRIAEGKRKIKLLKVKYGKEVETRIRKIAKLLKEINIKYPSRYAALKLLEGDKEIEKAVSSINPKIIKIVKKYKKEIERIHGHSCPILMASERYEVASKIVKKVQKVAPLKKLSLEEQLHNITTHKVWGYPIMAALLIAMFFIVFSCGDSFSTLLTDAFVIMTSAFEATFGSGALSKLIFSIIEGLVAGITVVLPYILPFYIILGILED